jgi:hypothetical protein
VRLTPAFLFTARHVAATSFISFGLRLHKSFWRKKLSGGKLRLLSHRLIPMINLEADKSLWVQRIEALPAGTSRR